jgi:hypothetical protein
MYRDAERPEAEASGYLEAKDYLEAKAAGTKFQRVDRKL